MIALALGEVASDIRWQFDAADARQALVSDFERDAGVMHERRLAKRCIDRRLGDVETLLKQAARTGVLPLIGSIGRPPTRPMLTAAWDTSISSGVLPHLPRREVSGISANFDQIKEMKAELKTQSVLWARLAALENAPGPVSQELLATLMITTAELRKSSAYVDTVAGQVVAVASDIGKLDYWLILDRENGTATDVITGLRALPICSPLLVDGKPVSRRRG
ncbi:hypothetical protein P1X14_21785 [Sphingomonas sp. AOB5]|uniref:hypothetical protein n=1 Tax=Sphingomonas sp. AOB5 TaxID=3034017 RepID=UPI0023F850ED|nr:hypothetical protein [Sphingomonas sp. AOB5]MDF7777902.1 hypothetical protein [Sphingomonas sp. AOB5]